ncbi:hypothetical protein [Ketobacter alkanivorans]|uniref:Uncharacterized protein n=1 Tax=Ketobacter alkanivorans TaxID=1917421 RepID=A0A2K9LIJ0_9GAMM|nr:hypothetical protein [Ketobacter alkanivorans]AUM12168.1 hypothetical protein Kalk_06985 [Ketobacter alkanivorans]
MMNVTKKIVLVSALFVSALSHADTLMLQITVEHQNHRLFKAWTTTRDVAAERNAPAEQFIRVVAYNNSGGQVYEYFLEDSWLRLAALPVEALQDYQAPDSYILKIPNPQNVDRVELFRGSISEMEQSSELQRLLVVDKVW